MQVRLSSGDYKGHSVTYLGGGGVILIVGETTPIGTNFIIGLKGGHSKQLVSWITAPPAAFQSHHIPFLQRSKVFL